MIKKVDALHETDTIIFSERKFFEMECQVLNLGEGETEKPEIALHYFYPFNEEPISGLKDENYFIQTYIHDQLQGDHSEFESIVSFNKTFGNIHNLKIF